LERANSEPMVVKRMRMMKAAVERKKLTPQSKMGRNECMSFMKTAGSLNLRPLFRLAKQSRSLCVNSKFKMSMFSSSRDGTEVLVIRLAPV